MHQGADNITMQTAGSGLPLQDKMKNAFSKKLLSDQSILNQMQGEFSVIKGYGNDEAAALYSVSSHHKAKGQDHILYAVNVSSIIMTNYGFIGSG